MLQLNRYLEIKLLRILISAMELNISKDIMSKKSDFMLHALRYLSKQVAIYVINIINKNISKLDESL